MTYKESVEKVINGYLEEVDFLVENQKYQLSFLLMSQIIEFLGALIDDKPLRAKDQSKNRFSLAIKKLFPYAYFKLNDKDFFYTHYRCNMSHLLTTSNFLELASTKTNSNSDHLRNISGKVVLMAEPLFNDVKTACAKLVARIERGDTKEKKGLYVSE